MRLPRFGAVTALALLLATVAVPLSAQAPGGSCGAPFRVVQSSFQRLSARNAFVWVDGIQSGFTGGYSPFQIVVVVGSAYPPFNADQGRLDANGFARLMKSAYGVTRANATVSPAAVKTGLAVPFTAAQQKHILRVVSVQASMSGDSAVTAMVCR